MRQCEVCGNTVFREGSVNEIFRSEEQMVTVEHIPALVCERCGEKTFDRETVDRVRRSYHEQQQPSRQIVLEVFDFV